MIFNTLYIIQSTTIACLTSFYQDKIAAKINFHIILRTINMKYSWLILGACLVALTYSVHFIQSMQADGNKKMKDAPKEKTKIDYVVRKGTLSDRNNLKALYKKVATIAGGLARTEDEITDAYIDKCLESAVNKGIIFVAEYDNKLIGSVLKYHLEPKVFAHVLGEGSILVDPDYQGIGVGTKIFTALLDEVKNNHPEILRVELIARESNPAIKLYERLGFKAEGRFERRIKGIDGRLEADIPMAWFNPNFKENKN